MIPTLRVRDFSFISLFLKFNFIPALRRLRASSHVEEDIEEMRAEEAASQTEAHMSMLQLVRSSALRMPLTIGIVMQLSQQLSGINAVSKYSVF